MSQILANAGQVTLTLTWYVSGTPTDVDDVTIGIVDGNGATVVSAGTATTNNEDGTYTYQLADQANPKILTVTWTDTSSGDTRVDRIEVVGGWLFTEAQARAFRGKDNAASAVVPLASSSEYTDATIAAERSRLTDDLEYWTGTGWVARYARIVASGTGSTILDLSKGKCQTADGVHLHRPGRLNDISDILTVTIDGTTVDADTVTVDGRHLHLPSYWTASSTPFNVAVEYVYGFPYLVDGVDRIALMELVDRLVPSAVPDRVLSHDGEYGTTRFIQPGGPMGNVSRLPQVNDWVARHDRRVWI